MDLPERIFAWYFRVAAEAGLRWDDLINTAPSTTVLTKEGLIGFAANAKTRGRPEGRPWGEVDMLSLMGNGFAAGLNCF